MRRKIKTRRVKKKKIPRWLRPVQEIKITGILESRLKSTKPKQSSKSLQNEFSVQNKTHRVPSKFNEKIVDFLTCPGDIFNMKDKGKKCTNIQTEKGSYL